MRARLRAFWLLVNLWATAEFIRFKSRVRRALGVRAAGMHAIWDIRHYSKDGELLFGQVAHNMLHDEGEEFIVDVVFDETQSVPANYYIGLDARASLAEADALTDLVSEPSGNGYAREAVASDNTDFTNSQDSGDWQALTKTVTFTASGGSIGAVTKAFLTTVSTGTAGVLISSVALSQSRTLADGESLDVSMYIKLSE